MAQVDVPYMGLVNVFSVHLSWWNSGYREQLAASWSGRSSATAERWRQPSCAAISTTRSDRKAFGSRSNDTKTKFSKAGGPGQAADNDPRIDYVFMKKGNRLQAVSARMLFTDSDYGRVSDHPGIYVEFEPAAKD